MHALYQRLRELDWDTFQRLAYQLLSARHPGLEVRHVEGAGGDEGLDVFEGVLNEEPTVWQCKHFPNGLGPRQRPQVTESLRTVLDHFRPAQWVLVVGIDLDTKGHRWFQKLQCSYASKTAVGLFQASDIVRELIHRRNIRDAFFPGAVFDTITVARAISDIGVLPADRLQQLSNAPMDELIARLEEADARFHYQIVYGPNVGQSIAETPPEHPLLVASVLDGDKRVDVFARDIEAIKLDPPRVKFSVRGAGVEKFQEFIKTGKRQELNADEISTPTSTFDFLLPEKQISGWKVTLMPSESLAKRVVPLRVTFSNGVERVSYECIRFRVASAGSEQIEIESVSPLPFALAFELPTSPDREGLFRIQAQFQGADVRTVAKALRAFSLLRSGGTVEIYALEIEKPLGTLSVTFVSGDEWKRLGDIMADAATVSDQYKTDLQFPNRITNKDLRSLAVLRAMMEGSDLPFDGLNAKLVKSREHETAISEAIGHKLHVVAQFPRLLPSPVLFGKAINTGPITLIGEGEIDEGKSFLQRYTTTQYGKAVPLRFSLTKLRAQLGGQPTSGLFVKPSSN